MIDLAAKHGYRPNPMVTALMSQVGARLRRRTESIIGLLTSSKTKPHLSHSTPLLLREGIDSAAGTAGYLVENFIIDHSAKGSTLPRMLHTRCVRGLLINLTSEEFDSIAIDRGQFAIVAYGFEMANRKVDFVQNDHGHTATLAIENLWRLGYRRIGMALKPRREHAESSMLASMLLWQYQENVVKIPPIAPTEWSPECFLEWYRREKPDAIICSDHLALDWLRRSNVSVPGDVVFAHVDLDFHWKGIAGVDQCNREVGAVAMDLLIGLLTTNRFGSPSNLRTVKVQGRWVDGETAPPRHAR